MNGAFHVQGRLIERRGLVVVRDETRRVDVPSRDEAFRIAEVLRGDGFTVWVWAVDARTVPASLELVERLSPTRRAGPAPPPMITGWEPPSAVCATPGTKATIKPGLAPLNVPNP